MSLRRGSNGGFRVRSLGSCGGLLGWWWPELTILAGGVSVGPGSSILVDEFGREKVEELCEGRGWRIKSRRLALLSVKLSYLMLRAGRGSNRQPPPSFMPPVFQGPERHVVG
ncbi:hypothetical protein BO70DRAFT_35080 [Aspergillus heteromorphus CBS 117.55]|uniref:Uncharacterized protein n=1 Tax=Aspergillus heteromorphus CBS 117.55 TaxID=1448321 RepID=A0A317WAN6_9EURO|nr:uncharacterized protein BO70DRAFT_35080 [Aspergillus heteromorphus CBS 117.55]PWY82058.1 hypothetical protein BO70DRAFT_35080 [Aspergillus heteromorphus CBS 117.55]